MRAWVKLAFVAIGMALGSPAVAQSSAAPVGWSVALDRKCTAGDALACWQVGASHELGRGTPVNPVKAFAAFSKACAKGIGEACVLAGRAQEKGIAGIPVDPVAALALYTRGCEVGQADACLSAANRAKTGRGTATNAALAMTLYERACTLRDVATCRWLAEQWDGQRNGPLALRYYIAACNAGQGESCSIASSLAQGNRGVARDLAASDRYAALGCSLNHFGGCMSLGYNAANRGHYADAVRWYARACALGNQQNSCKAKQDMELNLANATAGGAERARWNAAQAAGAGAVDQLLRAGNYAAAINKAAYDLGSADQVSRVLVAAQGAGRIGDIEDAYFWAFGTWQLNAQARAIADGQFRGRRLGRTTVTAASSAPVDSRFDGIAPGGPSLADQALATQRRQREENCAAWRAGSNRVCNRN